MKLTCHLRQIRDGRKLADISAMSGVSIPRLSQIERGVELPRDAWLQPLADAYGKPVTEWYAPAVLLALTGDDA